MNARQYKKRARLLLELVHQTAIDADDTLEAAGRAIIDDDIAEAQMLIALGRESIAEHIETLKGLL